MIEPTGSTPFYDLLRTKASLLPVLRPILTPMALRELTVENLAVVESVRLSLAPGFTVLTGETGAGKSLVVDAVALALGARASADQVRAGTDAARVEAVFDAPPPLDDDPLADVVAAGEGVVIVRREVGADGRSLGRGSTTVR